MTDWQFGILFLMMLGNLLKDVINREHEYSLEKRKKADDFNRKLSLSALHDPSLKGFNGILRNELIKDGIEQNGAENNEL